MKSESDSVQKTPERAKTRRLRHCERAICVDVDGEHEVWVVDWVVWSAGRYDPELALQEWASSRAGERDGPIMERYRGGAE